MKRAIVLVSGGMDSLVSTTVAARDCEELNFLHVSYGQRTQERELKSFEAISAHYGPRRSEVLNWDWLSRIGGSALTDPNKEIPNQDPGKELPSTYVPFRNANLLCAAVSWAEAIHSDAIYIGAVEEDSSGYPDCREVFFKAFEEVIASGSRNAWPIRIVTPVLHLSKAEIVKLGMELKAPFELSWSCYADNTAACGVCESCRLRLKAFAEAGYKDPITYRGQ
ncbi:MAG TPA: 7-cyano-7-deazaguanine synthase QueC [Candidatus Syntrophosphaera sp.]|nr:7-cyano-7-deazaguanine synthase QueC [Candidatus Syntrophosphaera sp.]